MIRPEKTIAILYREMPDMLQAKDQPNWPNGSGIEVV